MPYQPTVASTPLEALNNYFINLYPLILNVILKVIGALIIFLVGWLIALIVKLAFEFLLSKLKINEWFRRAKLDQYFQDFNWEERLDKVLAEIFFWVVFVIFLMTAFDVLGLQIVNSFIGQVVSYIPTAIVGGLILLFGFLFAELTRKVLLGVFRGLEKKSAQTVAFLAKWTIIIFSFLIALSQWGVARDVINILVMGVVFFLALAGGLAFGLGGQETAREILENIKKHLR